MNKIIDLENNNEFKIEISIKDYVKIKNTINVLKRKYNEKMHKLHVMEKKNNTTFDIEKFVKEIIKEKNVIINIIIDVLEIYKDELNNIECVFLSGSYARNTNKLASDLDLHIFYKDGVYDYKYEEIVSYIISRIINKSRDCIDPTFILNLDFEYKEKVSFLMTKQKLNIILQSQNKSIKYSYKNGKKRRFFLQYNNCRKIECLETYILKEIKDGNPEWCHCFNVIYGEECFKKIYNNIIIEEKKQLNLLTICSRIDKLKNELNACNIIIESNKISTIKNNYQSCVFEKIYEYVSIIRMILLYKNYDIPYINLYEMYNITKNIDYEISMVIVEIYKYMWILRKLTIYCYDNSINYGLHNDSIINYDTSELNNEFNILKDKLIKSLNEKRRKL